MLKAHRKAVVAMEGKMKVAVMTDVMKIEMTERDIPKPKEDEVLVKIEYVGVCT